MKGFLPVQGRTRRIISAVNPECCQHMVHHLHSLILQHAEVSNQLQLWTRSGSAVLQAKLEKPVALTEQILECRWWKTSCESLVLAFDKQACAPRILLLSLQLESLAATLS